MHTISMSYLKIPPDVIDLVVVLSEQMLKVDKTHTVELLVFGLAKVIFIL